MIIILERRFEKLHFSACDIITLKKKLKQMIFSVEKDSQRTNVDDYHPLWMIVIQYGSLLSNMED
jgi:hypothetical protein